MSDDKSVATASAIVAVAVLLVIGAIAVVAIIRYDVTGAKEVLDWMAPLIAVVTGAFVGYFFTRGQVSIANRAADTATQQAASATQQAQALTAEATQAKTEAVNMAKAVADVAGELPEREWRKLKASNPTLQSVLRPS